jgi:hypothetical protein
LAEIRLVPLPGYRDLPVEEMRRGVASRKELEDIAVFVE